MPHTLARNGDAAADVALSGEQVGVALPSLGNKWLSLCFAAPRLEREASWLPLWSSWLPPPGEADGPARASPCTPLLLLLLLGDGCPCHDEHHHHFNCHRCRHAVAITISVTIAIINVTIVRMMLTNVTNHET